MRGLALLYIRLFLASKMLWSSIVDVLIGRDRDYLEWKSRTIRLTIFIQQTVEGPGISFNIKSYPIYPAKHTANSDLGPSKSTAAKCMWKPSATLSESALSEHRQKCPQDPETAAMLSNCDLEIDENEEEPPKKAAKKAAKRVLNESFFSTLPKNWDTAPSEPLI